MESIFRQRIHLSFLILSFIFYLLSFIFLNRSSMHAWFGIHRTTLERQSNGWKSVADFDEILRKEIKFPNSQDVLESSHKTSAKPIQISSGYPEWCCRIHLNIAKQCAKLTRHFGLTCYFWNIRRQIINSEIHDSVPTSIFNALVQRQVRKVFLA